jgi:hypothetical protein
MDYILTNARPIAAATLAGLAVLVVAGRGRWTGPRLGVAAVALFWLGSILAGALILAPVSAGAWTIALGSAFIIWVGFVLPALTVGLALRGQPWGRSLGDAGWWLAIMLAQAATLNAVGLIRPNP